MQMPEIRGTKPTVEDFICGSAQIPKPIYPDIWEWDIIFTKRRDEADMNLATGR